MGARLETRLTSPSRGSCVGGTEGPGPGRRSDARLLSGAMLAAYAHWISPTACQRERKGCGGQKGEEGRRGNGAKGDVDTLNTLNLVLMVCVR